MSFICGISPAFNPSLSSWDRRSNVPAWLRITDQSDAPWVFRSRHTTLRTGAPPGARSGARPPEQPPRHRDASDGGVRRGGQRMAEIAPLVVGQDMNGCARESVDGHDKTAGERGGIEEIPEAVGPDR